MRIISSRIITEKTMAPVAIIEFEDGVKIRIVITRDMVNNYDIVYKEAEKTYKILKRKDKIKKLLHENRNIR